jgi:isocitrate dehydrogenase
VIIDASMPAMIRNGGRLYDRDGLLKDTKAVIPDRTYASFYQEVIEDCQRHGQFDPSRVGSVINIGLMAQRAEEYGSHDKTFVIPTSGMAKLIDAQGRTLLQEKVEAGDIWMVCQTRSEAVSDWIELAIERAQELELPAIFWLDADRAHDRQLIQRVEAALRQSKSNGLSTRILPPREAMRDTLERFRAGKNTLAVTGNILRDYLTDLFPIIEAGTSAKVISLVPLRKGGMLLETGAGGTAPALMKGFLGSGKLTWDSLGEFLALSASLKFLSGRNDTPVADSLALALDRAIERLLEAGQSPSPEGLDTRMSHIHLATYWAEALSQSLPGKAGNRFRALHHELISSLEVIEAEVEATVNSRPQLDGWYLPGESTASVMRPSDTFNHLLDQLSGKSPTLSSAAIAR